MAAVAALSQAILGLNALNSGRTGRARLAGGFRRLVAASCLLALISLLVAGCATVPRDIPRPPSVAFQDHENTALGRQIAKDAAGRPGHSGFSLMRYGHEAFTARIALADLAQKSIDVQYYIWEADATGRILAERLTRAAERGCAC
jgi:putative cardiolipin synthase